LTHTSATDILDRVLPLVPKTLLEVKNASGSTALHWAALNSQLDCAKKLVLVGGADLVDIKNSAGLSPLAEAERAGWDEGAKYFVEVMNLESGDGVKEEEADAPVDPNAVEIEIEDADGGIAKMTLNDTKPKP
jgi:uncharacterized protein